MAILKSSATRRTVLFVVVTLVIFLLSPHTVLASANGPEGSGAGALTLNSFYSSDEETTAARGLSVDDSRSLTLTAFVENSSKAVSSNSVTLVRPNQEYRIQVRAYKKDSSVAGLTISVSLSGVTLLDNTKMISIEGGSPLSGYPENLTAVTDQNGLATINLRTVGFEESDVLVVNTSCDGVSSTPLVLMTSTPVFSLISENQVYAVAPGATTKLSLKISDQWGVPLSDSGYRVRLLQKVDGFTLEKSVGEATVVSGTALLTLNILPTARNRSAVLTGVLERFDSSGNSWVLLKTNSDPISVNVTEELANFQEPPRASVFADVSYFPRKIEWVSIRGSISLPGAEVTIDGGEGLIFRLSPNSQAVAGQLSLRASANGEYSFEVASTKSGLQTIRHKTGVAEALTVLSVAPALGSSGKSISFDRVFLPAGQTSKITGTLLDENGNPVQTAGEADVLVSWKGAGFPVGVGTVETDAAGKFSIFILVPAAERLGGTITAIYRPQGQSVDLGNISESQTLAVQERPDAVSVFLSSQNGQWIVMVQNAIGSEVAVKVGSKWHKSVASSNSFALSGRAQSGATVPVKVWVDGVLVSEQKLTIR